MTAPGVKYVHIINLLLSPITTIPNNSNPCLISLKGSNDKYIYNSVIFTWSSQMFQLPACTFVLYAPIW